MKSHVLLRAVLVLGYSVNLQYKNLHRTEYDDTLQNLCLLTFTSFKLHCKLTCNCKTHLHTCSE